MAVIMTGGPIRRKDVKHETAPHSGKAQIVWDWSVDSGSYAIIVESEIGDGADDFNDSKLILLMLLKRLEKVLEPDA